HAEWASSSVDLRHRFVTSVTYELPSSPQIGAFVPSRLIQTLLGGWRTAGVFVAQPGFPLTPSLSTNPANTTTPLRPNCLRDGNLPRGMRTVDRWFDPSAFAVPALYTFGNCGRDVLRAPGLVNLDLLLARTVSLSDRRHLELRAEVFNVANTVHLGPPNLF